MEKPISLRKETWDFLRKNMQDKSHISKLIQNEDYFGFGPILYKVGIINHPELLQETVIELDDEAEYIIDELAAQYLFEGKNIIRLTGLGTNRHYLINKERIINSIKDGPMFDQITIKSKK